VEPKEKKRKYLRGTLRWGMRLALLILVLILGAFLGIFAPQLYHHFWLFPKQAEAWKELTTQREPVALQTGWNEYRGVMHSHSHISHDSEVEFPEIVEALHKAQCQFIFMTDHVVDGKADYSLGWRGVHDGILFVQGYEMQEGFMPWGLPEGTVLRNDAHPAELAKEIRQLGGVLCLGHVEAGRPFHIPEIDGMEIYNIHTDLIDELVDKHSRPELVKEFLINLFSYGDQTLRHMFDWWTLAMLVQKWDEQSLHRKITAIAANDCHQNVGVRGIYTAQDTLLLLDTGHNDPEDKLYELDLNVFTRSLLRLLFGRLEADKQLFRIDADPYDRSARFVNTHLLATELTEPALIDALRTGRAFIAFNMLADASGFAYVAQGNGEQATMGEQIAFAPGLRLLAEAPLSCRFTLFRDGKKVTDQEGRTFEHEVTAPGKYRIQADLPVPGEISVIGSSYALDMAPWVLTNQIEVTAAGAL
jgi:hypothetical protein